MIFGLSPALAVLERSTFVVFTKSRRMASGAILLLGMALLAGSSAQAVTIPTVPVGNAGNVPISGFGAVAYNYRIGTYEVTIGQYTAFLNSVAVTDTYGLYNTSMTTDLYIAGIARSGISGSYAYSVIGSPNKPITYVSWGDAARFANWMHNGQPTGPQNASTTEDGAYTLNGVTSRAGLMAITRNADAKWFIPSDSEWYKAAYHKNDGPSGNYWDWPTQDNPLFGNFQDISGSPDPATNYLTDVGAYSLSAGPYGTYDQAGNVFEWTERLFGSGSLYRGVRGGSWDYPVHAAARTTNTFESPEVEQRIVGFRLATVPEPSTFVLAALGVAGLFVVRRRRSHTNPTRERGSHTTSIHSTQRADQCARRSLAGASGWYRGASARILSTFLALAAAGLAGVFIVRRRRSHTNPTRERGSHTTSIHSTERADQRARRSLAGASGSYRGTSARNLSTFLALAAAGFTGFFIVRRRRPHTNPTRERGSHTTSIHSTQRADRRARRSLAGASGWYCGARARILSTFLALAAADARAVTIATVPVGNAGNAPDPLWFEDQPERWPYGAVDYNYRIGKYEVTNAQYAEFLNAKAVSDTRFLYNTRMGGDGGITRGGESGSFTYAVKPNMGNKPVNFVSWYSAIRFANWLHNGQGSGDTETGAYTLGPLGGGPGVPTNGAIITRNAGAKWFLPSEDEWYKAAYYDPTLGGGTGGYWTYPTRSDNAPTRATINSVGDISNPGANVANYDNNAGDNWRDDSNVNVTTVGSAGPLSESYYGTSDQGGNVGEWNETPYLAGFRRTLRGGDWGNSDGALAAWFRNYFPDPHVGISVVGFRVATVPEPSTLALAAAGLAGLFVLRCRRVRRAHTNPTRQRGGAPQAVVLAAVSAHPTTRRSLAGASGWYRGASARILSTLLALAAAGFTGLFIVRRRRPHTNPTRERGSHTTSIHSTQRADQCARRSLAGASGWYCGASARILSTLLALAAADAWAVTIDTVPVGNAGNAADQLWTFDNPTNLVFGAVAYDYRIGTTEVTNAQYAAFLNAKAASDPLGLYNTLMGGNARGGITRSGASGSFTYATKPNMGDKPVIYVSWYDAIRFANWLHGGQGSADTETGAYTLGQLGAGGVPINGSSITRNAGAKWFLPSEDEWYKAAYHQPAAQGGDTDNYWLYPTGSNSVPTIATANNVGDISNSGPNVANYNGSAGWNGLGSNVTTVGSAGPLSESFYGTSDQGGNVWEWNEALFSGSMRGLRGGSWLISADFLAASLRTSGTPSNESIGSFGFRVATVPEPSTFSLAAVGAVGLFALRRRRVRHAHHSTRQASAPQSVVRAECRSMPTIDHMTMLTIFVKELFEGDFFMMRRFLSPCCFLVAAAFGAANASADIILHTSAGVALFAQGNVNGIGLPIQGPAAGYGVSGGVTSAELLPGEEIELVVWAEFLPDTSADKLEFWGHAGGDFLISTGGDSTFGVADFLITGNGTVPSDGAGPWVNPPPGQDPTTRSWTGGPGPAHQFPNRTSLALGSIILKAGSPGTYVTSFDPDSAIWLRSGDFEAVPIAGLQGFTYTVVPEPSSAVLLGLAGIGLVARRRRSWRALAVVITFGLLGTNLYAVTVDTVPVGNAGNAPDQLWTSDNPTNLLFGSVAYDYRIGKYEVTNAQYAEFLNFKAASDPLALYDANMGSNVRGGITQSGVSGSFTYATKPNMGDKPVNFVTWYDAIRFANWLHNGQGSGDTETGAYAILGGTPTPTNGLSITRNAGAKWFLPSEDEWYKAAYYDPTLNGGTGGYWLYPTRSNTAPTANSANANSANFGSFVNTLTDVGAYVNSASPYGTYDQGGNVWEWNETLISGTFRGLRGASYTDNLLQSSFRGFNHPTAQFLNYGFRVAAVPEPSTFALAAVGILGILASARRVPPPASGV